MAELEMKGERKEKAKTIHKRSMKNFNSQDWNKCLAGKNWEELGRTEDVNEMADLFDLLARTFQFSFKKFSVT